MRLATKMAISQPVSIPLSRNLSYTNSLDPGEDSQLNALAIVDKLVDFGADLPWQASNLSKEAEQSCVKGSQSVKGVQVLAQSADAKNRQCYFGVFDWIDSQSNDIEKDSSTIMIQGERVKEQNETQNVGCQSMKNSVVENIVNYEPHDLDAPHNIKDALTLDIGTNTQVALEAIDIMMHGSPNTWPHENEERLSVADIGDNTQTAVDAITILRHGKEPNTKQTGEDECRDARYLKQRVYNQISNPLQVKASLCGAPSGRKRSLPPKPRTSTKSWGKKGLQSRASEVTKKPEKTSSSKLPSRNFFDFTSVMVPRRKRSRFCSPRTLVNKNSEALGCREAGPNSSQEDIKEDNAKRGNLINNTEFSQLIVSTYVRRTKRDPSMMPDYNVSLDQSRKKRKCESKSVFVLFSHGLSEGIINEQKKILKKLGGHIATSTAKATHFIADCFARSRNMLEIMAAGKAVVTTNWLEGCSQAQYFVHEETYILTDAQKEKEWGFSMHSSLAASRRRPLLKGMTVVISPNTVPDFCAIKSIVESGGGQVLHLSAFEHLLQDNEKASFSFLLASEEDSDCCAQYIRQGFGIFSTEMLLHGVVTQSLDFSRNRLFVDEMC